VVRLTAHHSARADASADDYISREIGNGPSTDQGRRDHALLLLLYSTGAGADQAAQVKIIETLHRPLAYATEYQDKPASLPRPFILARAAMAPYCFIMVRICIYCFRTWLTSWTEVPLPFAMRLRRLPSMTLWSWRS
jgi:hypothetical protein